MYRGGHEACIQPWAGSGLTGDVARSYLFSRTVVDLYLRVPAVWGFLAATSSMETSQGVNWLLQPAAASCRTGKGEESSQISAHSQIEPSGYADSHKYSFRHIFQ